MSNNNIEDFISGNRNEFDDRSPSTKVWENIEAAVNPAKKQRSVLMPVINWALAAAAILAIGIFIFVKLNKEKPIMPETAKTETIDKTLPGASEVNEFAKLIDMKQEELKLLAKEQPVLYQKFTSDIAQLDSSYSVLKTQLNSTPNKEMLIEAMIQNLQLQLSVLNQQLNIIKQIKQTKKYSHEKNVQII